MLIYFFFFFFSSRRRHTRWPRDWSSDVCSSDLDALAVRRDLVHGEPAVIQADRAHPVVRVRGEIGARHRAARRLGVSLDFFRELAAVERLALRGGDLLQRPCLVGEAEDLSGARRAAVA